jgi:hypothetical protein
MEQAMPRSMGERGPVPTILAALVALLPLAIGVAAAVAADRQMTVGPLASDMLVYWVIVPLAVLYPTIAALARRLAYAPMTVLVVASIAPALVYAWWLLREPLPKDRAGQLVLSTHTILQLMSPAILAVGAFVSIEIASAAMRRGVAVGVFGCIAASALFAVAFLGPLLFLNLLPS